MEEVFVLAERGVSMGYHRAQERNRRLKKLYDKTSHGCGAGVWYNDAKGRFIKYSGSNTPGYAKFLRKQGNRKLRRNKESYNHGSYRKNYDYWWILY